MTLRGSGDNALTVSEAAELFDRIYLPAGEDAAAVRRQLPEGYEARTAPRSSTFRRWGILQANSVGVIDNSYCGTNDEWKLPVYATRDTVIEKGDRICQFRIFAVQPPVTFEECDTLSDTDRGGFGSTGVK